MNKTINRRCKGGSYLASIKQLTDRKFKITVSNGYRPNGKKICKAKTITVPDSVKPRGIPQYVAHEAEELERAVKSGFAEDRDTTFEVYASRWLERQIKYAPALSPATDGCWSECTPTSAPPSWGSCGPWLWKTCS